MRYVCLIYDNEKDLGAMSQEDSKQFMNAYFQFTTEIQQSGHYVAGEALQPVSTATSLRNRNGRLSVTDGPFIETKEQLGGFYLIDLRNVDAQGFLQKRLVLDLLNIADPNGISLPARPGELGVGNPFSFPLQSVESLEVLDGERLLIANDNNYPFSDGRWVGRDKPDDLELIIVRAPALR